LAVTGFELVSESPALPIAPLPLPALFRNHLNWWAIPFNSYICPGSSKYIYIYFILYIIYKDTTDHN